MTDSPAPPVVVRAELTPEKIDSLVDEFRRLLERRVIRKGKGLLVSRHEIFGVVAEEYVEVSAAVHDADNLLLRHELWDIAIAGAVGVASIDGGAR